MKLLKSLIFRTSILVIVLTSGLLLFLKLDLIRLHDTTPADSTLIQEKPATAAQINSTTTGRNPDADIVSTASKMRAAYTVLATATITGEAVDTAGKKLPKKFEDNIKNLLHGSQTFDEGLPVECQSAFRTIKQSVAHQGAVGIIDLAHFGAQNSQPSMFDIWMFVATADYLSEYSIQIKSNADPAFWSKWRSLADSSNPIYRLLALTQAHRFTNDKSEMSSFLAKYVKEEDVLIVHPLIHHLLAVGSTSAKENLKEISKLADERGDKQTRDLASTTLAKMQ